MNTVSVGNGLGELSLFSAALVLAYGLWTGQRQLGFQGMWRVLGTLAVTVVAAYLLALVSVTRSNSMVALLMFGLVSLALGFLPFLMAALQVGAIRDASQSDVSQNNLPSILRLPMPGKLAFARPRGALLEWGLIERLNTTATREPRFTRAAGR